ncbi:aminotransferase class I and II [Bifidobacterium margollesii]|uniref:cysteine-S-conjugate beta-lyase n=2 Tax=Bifidobacterium margollesii TaxID=2020964 RepID=A0A2N5JAN7_9BIFI|nr:aminotransferase class I and II [Bifidobacterium margollesii]
MSLLTAARYQNVHSIRWDEAINQCGDDVIALSVADMDFEAPKPIVDAVTQRASIGNYCYTYLDDDYYSSVIDWTKSRHNWEITPEEIVAVGRMVESTPAVLRETVGVGACVVVPYPAYSPTPAAIRAAGCHVIPWNLKLNGTRYEYDFESLEFLLEDADALVITNPHNPTGRVWSEDELRRIARIARERNVLVISDEFHMDLLHPGQRFHPYLSCIEPGDQAMSFIAPGKTFNIAGLETANIIVSDPDLREKVRKGIDDAGCHNPRFFAQAATVAGYRHCADWLDELLALVDHHTHLLDQALSDIDGAALIPPEGTYLAWIDLRNTGLNDEQLESRLHQQGLVLTPGVEFGNGGSGFMRMNLAVPTPLFEKALTRLAQAFA